MAPSLLLSSHLLHKIEIIADDLVIIGNGKIVASGSKKELLAAAGTLAGDGSVPTDAEGAGLPLTEDTNSRPAEAFP